MTTIRLNDIQLALLARAASEDDSLMALSDSIDEPLLHSEFPTQPKHSRDRNLCLRVDGTPLS